MTTTEGQDVILVTLWDHGKDEFSYRDNTYRFVDTGLRGDDYLLVRYGRTGKVYACKNKMDTRSWTMYYQIGSGAGSKRYSKSEIIELFLPRIQRPEPVKPNRPPVGSTLISRRNDAAEKLLSAFTENQKNGVLKSTRQKLRELTGLTPNMLDNALFILEAEQVLRVRTSYRGTTLEEV